MADAYELMREFEPPVPVGPTDSPSCAPYEIVDEELLWPMLVTEANGMQWVQIVDRFGHFTGYDPSFEQIAAVVEATTTPDNEQYRYARVAELVRTTVEMHDELAWLGGEDLGEYELSPEMVRFLTTPDLWRRTFRRTQQARQGQQ